MNSISNELPIYTRLKHRQEDLFAAMQDNRLDALALNPSPSLTYLTGLQFHLSERPVIAIFTTNNPMVIVLPELEITKTIDLPFKTKSFSYGEAPDTWQSVFLQAAQYLGLDGCRVGIESNWLRFLELSLLQNSTTDTNFIPAQDVLAELRMVKDEDEIRSIRKAVQIAQTALDELLPSIKPGVSERRLSSELSIFLLKAGSDPNFPFFPIVSTGPNSANPHAAPSDRKLAKGDLLVIDYGAAYQGYISDITRTFAIGNVQPEYRRIYELVEASNAAGRDAVRPGISAGKIDDAARQVIEAAGYGQFFIHRTGHGIGREGHEQPYIRGDNDLLLKPGMTFTIEPGIYLPNRGGVRIEDNVLVTESGGESLSNYPRGLQIIDV